MRKFYNIYCKNKKKKMSRVGDKKKRNQLKRPCGSNKREVTM